MRRSLIALAAACAISLGGCAGGSVGGGTTAGTVQQIIEVTKQVCGFVPTATTVANVIATFTGGSATIGMIGEIANGICAAVTAKAARRSMRPAKYRGVVIQGRFASR